MGDTLTLPSPTHPSHIDVQATVRSLRRSLSRSPSKFNLNRTASQMSHYSDVSAGSNGSLDSASPVSPSLRRMNSQPLIHSPSHNATAPAAPFTPSLLATPFRPNVKLSLRSAKSSRLSSPSTSAQRSATRLRTSPKSPVRRVLSTASSSSANSVPSSCNESDTEGLENSQTDRAKSPASGSNVDKAKGRHSMHLDISGSSLQPMFRLSDGGNMASATASALKRSDATMSVDHSSMGSPKAKRRSCGPSTFGADFNIFDHGPGSPGFDIHDETSREYDWTGAGLPKSSDITATPIQSAMPRRTGSLRKSTLQQRHVGDRTSWGRRQAAQQLSQLSTEASTPNSKNRPRLSLDHYMPPPQRDSPFGIPAPLPNPSTHVLGHPFHQPHPLSRTLTTSSSSSSVPDESPTHFPVQIMDKPRAAMNWSKSLPIGAVRPTADRDTRPTASISTPDYKAAKPFLGAFASTGLVSKMNRNPELAPSERGGAAVPDTPCKKHVNGFATYPPMPGSAVKARGRHIKHTFGAPSTPFNPIESKAEAQNTFGEQLDQRPGLFSGLGSRQGRKGSLLSIYSDEGHVSAEVGNRQMATEGENPPTPTKQLLLHQNSSNLDQLVNDSPTASRHIPAPTSALGARGWRTSINTLATPIERRSPSEREQRRLTSQCLGPPDASRLSISNQGEGFLLPTSMRRNSNIPPATPTTRQDNSHLFHDRRAITPTNAMLSHEVDAALLARFDKVERVGHGEFSDVYRVVQQDRTLQADNSYFSTPIHHTPPSPSSDRIFAVKKLRLPIKGASDRALRMREVTALEALRSSEHVVHLLDSWEERNNLYIQTEYCEEGSLDAFLANVGVKSRLDDFRIWKIMLEIGQGLRDVHNAGFVHLDLKPANILINFEGTLKIGDFGMATALPADTERDFEGDREYLAPEVIRGEIDKPADIFSLGLIMLEIAANVKLPENGATWTALREGDFREVPALTQDADAILRDATGMPVDESDRNMSADADDNSLARPVRRAYGLRGSSRPSGGDIFGLGRKSELLHPPEFMSDVNNPNSLDVVVKWMLTAETVLRPNIEQLLQLDALRWIGSRRRAGATVFEGNWGPSDEQLEPISLDTEMTDV